MITIQNTNPEFGDTITFTAPTLEQAIDKMEKCIIECWPEFSDITVTDNDYEIISEDE